MKNKFLFLLVFVFFCNWKIQAQIILCDAVPLSYDSIDFTTAIPISFGDSMITFQITNDHPTQSFAYPLAKLVSLTPLPSGMSLTTGSSGWNVFASSWNTGVTMQVGIFYNVNAPIPVNYSVTFQLWVSNLLPLLIDSCYFDSTFTVNLNPSPLTLINQKSDKLSISYDFSQNNLKIEFENPLKQDAVLYLYSITGAAEIKADIKSGTMEKNLTLPDLKPGAYFLYMESGNQIKKVFKVFIANKQ